MALRHKSEMTLDHSFLSDSRNFFVWPRVISVHSYYLTSLVTSHFCRLTIFPSLTDPFRNSYFHSIHISLSAGSSYMSAVIRRMESPEWLIQRFSLSSNGFVFPAWNIGEAACIFFHILLLDSFFYYALSLPSHVLSEKVPFGFCFRFLTVAFVFGWFTVIIIVLRISRFVR